MVYSESYCDDIYCLETDIIRHNKLMATKINDSSWYGMAGEIILHAEKFFGNEYSSFSDG